MKTLDIYYFEVQKCQNSGVVVTLITPKLKN